MPQIHILSRTTDTYQATRVDLGRQAKYADKVERHTYKIRRDTSAMRKLIPYIIAAASFVAPGCQSATPLPRPVPQPTLELVDHVEGAGLWTDAQPTIEAQALGADRVVFRTHGETRTATQPPFELETHTLPRGAVPFTVEAYFPDGTVLSIDSGAYVKDPADSCSLDALIEPPNRGFIEGIIADRTDSTWHPSLPDGMIMLTPLDEDVYAAFRELTIDTLMRLDRRVVESVNKIYLASSITLRGLPVGGVNQQGVDYIGVVATPSDIDRFVHTLLSENATLQLQPYHEKELVDAWNMTNPHGYTDLSYEEYLEQRGSARTPDLDVDLLKSHNFVNFYGSTNRPEDMSQFMAMTYRTPDRMLYFASTVPHTGDKLEVFDEAFRDSNAGIDYVECLAHER